MTFQQYFTECQNLITKEIELPFDVPLNDNWINQYNFEFSMYQYIGLTPEQAVNRHFADIDNQALRMNKKKQLTKNRK